MKHTAQLEQRVQVKLDTIEVGSVITVYDKFAAATYFYILKDTDEYVGYLYDTSADWIFSPIETVDRDTMNDFFKEINYGKNPELEFIDPYTVNIPANVLNDIFS